MNKVSKTLITSILKLDLFGEGIGFTLNGKDSIKSIPGFLMSIVILVTVLLFGANQFL